MSLQNDFSWCLEQSNPENTALVSSHIPHASAVTQVRAHDPDSGMNAKLSYHFNSIPIFYSPSEKISDKKAGNENNKTNVKNDNISQIAKKRGHKTTVDIETAIRSKAPTQHDAAQFQSLDTESKETFFLNSSTGIITVFESLKNIEFACVVMDVVVRDHGLPHLNSTSRLFLHINQSLPFIPIFDLTKAKIDEDQSGFFTNNVVFFSNHMLLLLAAVGSVCVVCFCLFVAIIVVLRKKESERKNRKYNCRVEALRILTTHNSHDASNNNSEDDKNACCNEVLSDLDVETEHEKSKIHNENEKEILGKKSFQSTFLNSSEHQMQQEMPPELSTPTLKHYNNNQQNKSILDSTQKQQSLHVYPLRYYQQQQLSQLPSSLSSSSSSSFRTNLQVSFLLNLPICCFVL